MLYCVTQKAQSYAHWYEQFLQLNYLGLGFVFLYFIRANLFVLGLVIWRFVYFLFVIVWLSVPVQSIAWKDSSEVIYYV